MEVFQHGWMSTRNLNGGLTDLYYFSLDGCVRDKISAVLSTVQDGILSPPSGLGVLVKLRSSSAPLCSSRPCSSLFSTCVELLRQGIVRAERRMAQCSLTTLGREPSVDIFGRGVEEEAATLCWCVPTRLWFRLPLLPFFFKPQRRSVKRF